MKVKVVMEVGEIEDDFKIVTTDDIELLKKYLRKTKYVESNHNIVNLMNWNELYPLFYVEKDGYLLLLGIHQGTLFLYMPLCEEELFTSAIRHAKSIFDHYQHPFVLSCFTKKEVEKVLSIYPQYQQCSLRQSADYVYEVARLIDFKGKKLQKKRNHLNAFYKEYGDRYVYERIDQSNVMDCIEFVASWNSDSDDEFLRADVEGTLRVLDNMELLEARGGLLRIDGKVEAIAIGSVVSCDMCQENIEKANESFRGIYQAILKEWLQHECSEFTYVNREDDMGYESLRQAKLAYDPLYLIEKFRLCEKGVE